MKKRKGAALPGAIMLCMFLLLVAFAVSFILLDNVALSKVRTIKDNYYETYLVEHNRYVSNGGDISKVKDDTFIWRDYEKESTQIKALVAFRKNNMDIMFYSIYDFDPSGDGLLAFQTSNFYITSEIIAGSPVFLLGGIVPFER